MGSGKLVILHVRESSAHVIGLPKSTRWAALDNSVPEHLRAAVTGKNGNAILKCGVVGLGVSLCLMVRERWV
jgi:hypothetical protein